ncbi:reticulocyte-binding protein 2 homolog a [Elysia marginata]|uniref:Reticulocyte-binding protein 2 homolog a n=1 Tax=Elysia marginata TaxID=1093978 RepID=A0AAV4I5R1_9GAST|nr:reticulocyte-binding protein 2 homolog a [Elysia marginata]
MSPAAAAMEREREGFTGHAPQSCRRFSISWRGRGLTRQSPFSGVLPLLGTSSSTLRPLHPVSVQQDGQSPVWVSVDVQESASVVSDDFTSQRSMTDFELRGPSERGDNQYAVTNRTDRPFTPVRSERSVTSGKEERSVMLSEGASVLSSLMEEDFLAAEPVEGSDDELPVEGDQWPGRDQVESRASSRHMGHTDNTAADLEEEDTAVTQPLQAPYTTTLPADLEDAQSTVRSQAETEEDHDKASPVGELESPQREETVWLAEPSAKPRQSTKTTSPTPRPASSIARDPDTLVSMHKDENEDAVMASLIASDRTSPPAASSKANLILQLTTASSPSQAADSSMPSTTQDVPEPTNLVQTTARSNDEQTLLDLSDNVDSMETPQKSPVTPKRRQPVEEPRKSLIDDVDGEDIQDEPEDASPGGERKLSERVIKEKEERKKRAAQKKEEQEREAAEKQAEAERLKQEADDKKQAAEDRLRQRAEEAARRKEEQLKRKLEASQMCLAHTQKRQALFC